MLMAVINIRIIQMEMRLIFQTTGIPLEVSAALQANVYLHSSEVVK